MYLSLIVVCQNHFGPLARILYSLARALLGPGKKGGLGVEGLLGDLMTLFVKVKYALNAFCRMSVNILK